MTQETVQERYQAIFERKGLPNPKQFSLTSVQLSRFETPTYLIQGDHDLLLKIVAHPDLGKGMQNGIIQCADSEWYRMSEHDSRALEWNICRLEKQPFTLRLAAEATGVQASRAR